MSASGDNDINPLTRSQAKRLCEHDKDFSDGERSESSSSDTEPDPKIPSSSNSQSNLNKDNSKIYILIDSSTVNKILKGLEADQQKFINDLNFLLLTKYFQWSKDSAVVIEAKIFGVKISVVVNTGFSGVAIS